MGLPCLVGHLFSVVQLSRQPSDGSGQAGSSSQPTAPSTVIRSSDCSTGKLAMAVEMYIAPPVRLRRRSARTPASHSVRSGALCALSSSTCPAAPNTERQLAVAESQLPWASSGAGSAKKRRCRTCCPCRASHVLKECTAGRLLRNGVSTSRSSWGLQHRAAKRLETSAARCLRRVGGGGGRSGGGCTSAAELVCQRYPLSRAAA